MTSISDLPKLTKYPYIYRTLICLDNLTVLCWTTCNKENRDEIFKKDNIIGIRGFSDGLKVLDIHSIDEFNDIMFLEKLK